MTDIVERLRLGWPNNLEITDEAADEIERLRARVINLPDGKYVMFSEGGGGQPSRIIIQFENMDDMHKAFTHLVESLKP